MESCGKKCAAVVEAQDQKSCTQLLKINLTKKFTYASSSLGDLRSYRGLTEYIIAWFCGTRRNEVATSARVVVPGSARACAGRRLINRRARAVPGLVRACVGLCQLINRRFTVHATSDVPNKKFSKNQRVLPNQSGVGSDVICGFT